MPIAYMIHGFLGAGKTTFSKKLEKERNALRFTPDDWMVTLYGSNPPEALFRSYEKAIKIMMWDLIEQGIKAGADVILDFGFWQKKERLETREKLEKMGATVLLYTMQCPDPVAVERVLKRTADLPQGALVIDQAAIDSLRPLYEPIDPHTEESLQITTG